MKKGFFKKIISTCLAMALLVTSSVTVKANEVTTGGFNAGEGIKNWPSQVNAPYVDMVAWTTKSGYYIGTYGGGPTNLKRLSQDTGLKFFNLAFIQSVGSVANSKVDWGWGGISILSEGKNDEQYNGIKQSLRDLRASGGDATISFGGANGVAFWQTSQDIDVLYNTYLEIVNGYKLTRIDLDVEGDAQNKQYNIANAKAIKKLQDNTSVEVTLTVPVLPSGLTQMGLDVLEAYISNGVKLKLINIMAMCYGNGVLLPGENYGSASVRAIDSTKNQLKDYYKKCANTNLSDAEAYAKVGVTVSVGYESSQFPIFTSDLSKLVADHAKKNAIGMTSYWSLNRDAKLDNNQGIKDAYEHTKVFSIFGSSGPEVPGENTAPVINGVTNKKIEVGQTFRPLEGVTAADKEDGDLTNKIVVNGNVDTTKLGIYNLTYTVTDSKGLTASAKAVVEVVEKPAVPEDTYDSSKIYVAGDIVIYQGIKYRAKWWTKGDIPGKDQWGPWEKVS